MTSKIKDKLSIDYIERFASAVADRPSLSFQPEKQTALEGLLHAIADGDETDPLFLLRMMEILPFRITAQFIIQSWPKDQLNRDREFLKLISDPDRSTPFVLMLTGQLGAYLTAGGDHE